MKIKLFMVISDGGDGSVTTTLVGSMEEADEILENDQETRLKKGYYEAGFVEEIEIEIDENGKLIKGAWASTD